MLLEHSHNWLPAPSLLISIALALLLVPKILRKFGQTRKALLLQRYGWWCLLAVIVIEQSFLSFYVNEKIKYQDESFYQFIEKSRAIPLRPWNHDSLIVKCEYRTVSYLYYGYGFCIYSDKESLNNFSLVLYKPVGYLSLNIWSFPGMPFSKETLFDLNVKGEVIRDFREKGDIGTVFKEIINEWMPAPALLILILIILLFWPRILRKKGQSRQAFLFTRNGWSLLILAIVIEQSFIAFYLNKRVEQQDEVFYQFIKEARASPQWDHDSYIVKCEYRKIFLIYQYRMCIYGDTWNPETKELTFGLDIQGAGGYLSLISWLNEDRMVWDRIPIFALNLNGDVISDIRVIQERINKDG